HLLDPFAGSEQPDQPAPDTRGAFVALVGLLALHGDRAGLPVNFVAPKQPKPPADPNKRNILMGAAVAAVLLFAVGVLGFSELAKLDAKVKAMKQRNSDLDLELVGYEEDEKRYAAVNAWNESSVDMLDEIYDLTDRFPDPEKDKVRLSVLSISPIERTG